MLPAPTLLLTTKLYRPPADANWVARPELLARLHKSLTRKLTLISAPPGFGKTTLVRQWLDQDTEFGMRGPEGAPESGSATPTRQTPNSAFRNQVAWLSLDQGDNHLVQFLRYVVAAVRTCVPEACPTMQSLLAMAQLPSVDYLADLLVGELSTLAAHWVLVLDDYHHIQSSAVHQVMRHLLRYLPPTLHLVILTRSDPPLHLGRLRIEQQISELRARDLRFAPVETRLFLQRRVVQPLDDETLQTLQTRTEGWIAGLQLASISLQSQEPRQFVAHFRGSDQLLVGYLVEEVMAQLPATVQEFLQRTALPDRFCAPLADALLADSATPLASQTLIAQLAEQNLFLIPLDQQGDWYRYHDLFRDFLRHLLKRSRAQDELARLHQRASRWYSEAGLIEEGLRHALAAGDDSFAASLVEAQFHPLVNRQAPMYILGRWLHLFPEATIQDHPGLLIAQAFLSLLSVGPAFPPRLLARIEALLRDDQTLSAERRRSLQADLDLLHGIFAYAAGDRQRAVAQLEAALATLPLAHEFARAQATVFLSFVYTSQGEQAAARARLETAMAEATAQQRPTLLLLLGALAINQLYAAELADVARTTARLLAAADAPHARAAWQGVGLVDVYRGHAYYLQGVVCYEQNDLNAAAHHWRQVELLRYRTNPLPYHDSLVGQALIAQARGALGDALAYAQAAREFAEETRNSFLLANSAAIEVRQALRANKTADAVQLAQEFKVAANQGAALGLTLPILTRVVALLSEATPAALATALQISEACLGHASTMHNVHLTVRVTLLHALTLDALRRTADAASALERALPLAEPGGFMRTFLDLGAPLAGLLRTFSAARSQGNHGNQGNYVKRLLAAFAQEHNPAPPRDLTAHYAKLHGITPLTRRELELLALIRQRRSLQEIAETLVISPSTVKNHTHNIYTKLGVHNGRQAVAKAEELGLLPPA
jgi:LuxR family maltose regulon positive regulatory protein